MSEKTYQLVKQTKEYTALLAESAYKPSTGEWTASELGDEISTNLDKLLAELERLESLTASGSSEG